MDLQAEKTIYLHKGRMKWRRIGIKGIKDRNRVLERIGEESRRSRTRKLLVSMCQASAGCGGLQGKGQCLPSWSSRVLEEAGCPSVLAFV